jgi:putative membrane protein
MCSIHITPRAIVPLLVCSALGITSLVGAAEAPRAEAGDPAFTNPAFANPDTPGLLAGKPRADVPNTTDTVFLKQLAIGSRAEVELGRLAQERSSHAGIDDFGQHMVKDHSAANGKLASVARAAKVELPETLDAEHEAVRGELAALRGEAFDLRYLESQIKDHQKAAQLLIYEIGQGQHAGTRLFASETLPAVMAHLEKARALHAELTGAGPPRPPSAMR